jgi:NADH-quinone oxidoreductase subunit M
MGYLTLTILIPLIGALAIAFIPANYKFLIRMFALTASGLAALCAVAVFAGFKTGVAGFQMVYAATWVEALGIQFKVGVDGINIGLILLSGIED